MNGKFRLTYRLTVVLLLIVFPHFSVGETATGGTAGKQPDIRKLVDMPEQARQFVKADMIDHLAALNEILAYMAADKFEAAAEIAEKRMGMSAMGKHRGTGMGPGRYLPPEMHAIGMNMHKAASNFSEIAKRGEPIAAYRALGEITSSCVACHHSFRTQ